MRCNRDGNGPHFGEGQSLLPLERSGEVTYLTVGCADRIYRETVHAQTVRGVRTVKPLKLTTVARASRKVARATKDVSGRSERARAKS